MRRAGFTLIELLIVVAIIAILAAIAVPNFLEAQTRSKVAAVKSDLRTLAGALETYMVDNNHYPPGSGTGQYYTYPFSVPVSTRLFTLTSPISYISSAPHERFRARHAWGVLDEDIAIVDTYDYVSAYDVPPAGSGITSGGAWRVSSSGPDMYEAWGGRPIADVYPNGMGVDYDPTNGTVSAGDIVRVGALHTAFGDPLNPGNPTRPGIVRTPAYIEQWR